MVACQAEKVSKSYPIFLTETGEDRRRGVNSPALTFARPLKRTVSRFCRL